MSPAVHALLIYLLWAAFMAVAVVSYRSLFILTGRKAMTEFPADQVEGTPFYRRLVRAHLNTLENLPLYCVLVLAATLLNRLPAVDAVAYWIIVARVLQSLIHMVSGSSLAVALRFTCFFVQLALIAWVAFGLLP